jgi:hypothetical protein
VADTRIIDLLAIGDDQHDLPWLEQSLQAAVELELATIPPYLCGLWSIKTPTPDDPDSAYALIRSVVIEEMLHMGLACNMLTTIGGTPQITAPVYPSALPGGVRPGLVVPLAGLSQPVVHHIYQQIEYPEHPVAHAAATYPTIGAFYDAIAAAFTVLGPSIITGARQLSTNIGANHLPALTTMDLVQTAILTIKEQGEGTAASPDAPVTNDELAHYYRFGEIHAGRTLVQISTNPDAWAYEGDPVTFPDVWPMAQVPTGGYPELPHEKAFNDTYSELLRRIQQAWTVGGNRGQDFLGQAIGNMFSLGPLAVEMMQIPLPTGNGNYGPDFRMISP